MKIARRITVLFLLTCAFFFVQRRIAGAVDELQDCLNGCANAEGACMASADQANQQCYASCGMTANDCWQQARDDHQSCSQNCSLAYPNCPSCVNMCIENCDGSYNAQINNCVYEEDICEHGPYNGCCDCNYSDSQRQCDFEAGQCQTLCYQEYPCANPPCP